MVTVPEVIKFFLMTWGAASLLALLIIALEKYFGGQWMQWTAPIVKLWKKLWRKK